MTCNIETQYFDKRIRTDIVGWDCEYEIENGRLNKIGGKESSRKRE